MAEIERQVKVFDVRDTDPGILVSYMGALARDEGVVGVNLAPLEVKRAKQEGDKRLEGALNEVKNFWGSKLVQ